MREVIRPSDMDPDSTLHLMQQEDGDVIIEIFNGRHFASVEICSGSGGSMSPATWMALTKLMTAMEADEKRRPHTPNPPRRRPCLGP